EPGANRRRTDRRRKYWLYYADRRQNRPAHRAYREIARLGLWRHGARRSNAFRCDDGVEQDRYNREYDPNSGKRSADNCSDRDERSRKRPANPFEYVYPEFFPVKRIAWFRRDVRFRFFSMSSFFAAPLIV